jgi:hypothetical protein
MIIFSPNTIIKAADVNANFTESTDVASQVNPYKFSARRSTAQTPNGAAIVFNTELFDTNSNYDITNGRYTIPVSGFYQINTWCMFGVTAAPQDPEIVLRKNATATSIGYAHFVNMYNNVSNGVVTISTLVQLTAGDYIYVTGANLAVGTGAHENGFNGILVSV